MIVMCVSRYEQNRKNFLFVSYKKEIIVGKKLLDIYNKCRFGY